MANRKTGDFEKFSEFLSNADGDLTSSPESLNRLDQVIAAQLERASKAGKRGWIARSQAAREKFESSAQDIVGQLAKRFGSRDELVKAIQGGLLGGAAKQNFQLQFRNRSVNELSDDDLRSIVGDQELLDLLKKFKEQK